MNTADIEYFKKICIMGILAIMDKCHSFRNGLCEKQSYGRLISIYYNIGIDKYSIHEVKIRIPSITIHVNVTPPRSRISTIGDRPWVCDCRGVPHSGGRTRHLHREDCAEA